MPLDSKRISDSMAEKTKGAFPEREGATEADEGEGASRPGAMLRAALAAKDDDAIEEAIRQCVEGGYSK